MEDFGQMSSEELQKLIDECESDPYFTTSRPDGMMINHKKHEAILERRSKLYEAKFSAIEKKLDEYDNDITPLGQGFSNEHVKGMQEAIKDLKVENKMKQEELRIAYTVELDFLQKIIRLQERFRSKNKQQRY